MAAAFDLQAHRGGRGLTPESTLAGFRNAISLGVTTLETDLAVTKDDVLVLSHEPRLNPDLVRVPDGKWLAGVGPTIRSLTLAELKTYDIGRLNHATKYGQQFPAQQPSDGERFPTLVELYAMAGPGVRFNIETKIDPRTPELAPPPAEFARMVVDCIERHHVASRVVVQSFDFRTLVEVRKLAPSIRLSALIAGGARRSFVDVAREAANSEIVSPHFSLVTPELVRAAHEAHVQIVPWTANTAEQWRALADAKVDAIISDDPAALIAWLQSEHLR